ncbi:anoctamin-9-like protein [Lates japonicus]|uniref:Anoctamin-9-like protein n=1 Tax=Lates japonicus TaxID=270547 RepID=A0AAD3MRY5_LATJO|nr:anoctamin-9-like protein [Lates japonicus]
MAIQEIIKRIGLWRLEEVRLVEELSEQKNCKATWRGSAVTGRKTCRDEQGVSTVTSANLDWLRNYHLANTDAFSLFNEFLEMGPSLCRCVDKACWKSSGDGVIAATVWSSSGVIRLYSTPAYRYHYGPCAYLWKHSDTHAVVVCKFTAAWFGPSTICIRKNVCKTNCLG